MCILILIQNIFWYIYIPFFLLLHIKYAIEGISENKWSLCLFIMLKQESYGYGELKIIFKLTNNKLRWDSKNID